MPNASVKSIEFKRKAVISQQRYRQKMKEKGILICSSENRKKYTSNYHLKSPWAKSYKCAYSRCNNENEKYCQRGIKFNMTINDFKRLWFRDKAYLMKCPSIDRKNHNDNYTFSNCRFIERSDNCREGALITNRNIDKSYLKNIKRNRDKYGRFIQGISYERKH